MSIGGNTSMGVSIAGLLLVAGCALVVLAVVAVVIAVKASKRDEKE